MQSGGKVNQDQPNRDARLEGAAKYVQEVLAKWDAHGDPWHRSGGGPRMSRNQV